MTTATVVGSGPNGLAAAVTLAMAGVDVTVLEMADKVGGGTRTSELTLPGVLHDDCSAVHPVGAASPFFASLDLESHGLTWKYPEIDAVQPLDNGSAGVLYRSITETAAGLGPDGAAWQRFFGPLSDRFDDLTTDFFRPLLHVPRHPITLTKFGLNALAPASLTARRFRTPEARALFSGVAAHALYPLTRPTTSAVGVMMIAAGHKYGWPVAEGGSRAISDALVSILTEHGGKVETGVRVTRLQQIPTSDIVMLDLSPPQSPISQAMPSPASGTTLPSLALRTRSVQARSRRRGRHSLDQRQCPTRRNRPSRRNFRRGRRRGA